MSPPSSMQAGSYPFPELGCMGRLSGARCPQVSTGHRAPGHNHLPTARLWEPECRGRAHRPRLPSRPAHGGPQGTPFPSCEQWPPVTWRESPQALSPLQAGPGHPTAPLSQAYLDCAQRRRTRGRTNLLRTECLGSSGQPGSRANRLGMAGSPSMTWPQGRAGESLQVQRYGHHQGASRRNTSAGLSQITGLRPALPTRPPRPVLAALHLCVSSSTSPAGTTHSHRASVINLPVQASLRALDLGCKSLHTQAPAMRIQSPGRCSLSATWGIFHALPEASPRLVFTPLPSWAQSRPLTAGAHPPVTHPGGTEWAWGCPGGRSGPEDRGLLWSHRWDLGQMLPECSRTLRCKVQTRLPGQAGDSRSL